MNGPIVVDVGNTRIKWGRCHDGQVTEVAALAADAPDSWHEQLRRWPEAARMRWFVSGVHPQRRAALVAWLRSRGTQVQVLDSYAQLPLQVRVESPAKVGIDRLLNAVAANTRRPPDQAAVLVDLGSAITVDLVDCSGAFRGGAIFPGLRLMARALHDYTALLPEVSVTAPEIPPGTTTAQAMRAGIFWAVCGGIRELIARYWEQLGHQEQAVYVTGGDGPLFRSQSGLGTLWPEMTLEGILHSVAAHG